MHGQGNQTSSLLHMLVVPAPTPGTTSSVRGKWLHQKTQEPGRTSCDFVLHLLDKSGTEFLEWLSSRETFGLGYSPSASLLQSWATNFNTNPQSLFPGLVRKQGRKIVLGGFQSEMQRAGWRASFKGPVWAGLYVMSVWWTAACKLCTQGAESGGSGVQNQSGLHMHLSLNK